MYEEIRVLTSLTGLFRSKASLLLIIQPQYALEAGIRCLCLTCALHCCRPCETFSQAVPKLCSVAGLLRSKAVLLVTNQLQYAPEADTVLYLEDGEMVACGKFDDVAQNEGFASLLNEYEVCSLDSSHRHGISHVCQPLPHETLSCPSDKKSPLEVSQARGASCRH